MHVVAKIVVGKGLHSLHWAEALLDVHSEVAS